MSALYIDAHTDGHIDAWSPREFGESKDSPSEQSAFSDGTTYYWTGQKSFLTGSSVHAGIHCTVNSEADIELDAKMSFAIILFVAILKQTSSRRSLMVFKFFLPRDKTVYQSLDVDVLD